MFRTNKEIAHQVILIAITISTGAVTVGMLRENPCQAEAQKTQVEIANNFEERSQEFINDRF